MNMTNDVETRLTHSLQPPLKGDMDSASCASIEAQIQTEEERITMETVAESSSRTVRKGYAEPHLKGDALKCYNLEVENKKVIEAYDQWKESGDKQALDNYALVLYEKMEFLIKKHIGAHHFSYGSAEYEDLMQEGKLAIMEKIYSYDPRRAMPSSYFGPKIDELLRKCNHRESHMTDHYIATFAKLNKVAKQYGYTDCFDENLDPAMLSILSEVPIATVVNTLEQARIQHDSRDAEGFSETSPFASPEKLFEDKENSELIGQAFNSLSAYEQFIFRVMEIETKRDSKGNEKHWSARETAKYLSNPEVYLAFGLKKAPDNNAICSDLEIAKQKLRHYPGMKQRFGYKILRERPASYTEFKQADDSEIESAIEAGIISL